MKPIPTTYQGTRFRSRLEASWAAHFDKLRLPWCYEPEGFTLSDGTQYLPDFYLPSANAWAEIKGDHLQRVSKVEQFAADLWRESGAKDTYDQKSPMVVMFKTPHYEVGDSLSAWRDSAPIGVMAPGKGYSVGISRCRRCGATTLIALWQNFCRNCGNVCANGGEYWTESWSDFLFESHNNPEWFRFFRPSAVVR